MIYRARARIRIKALLANLHTAKKLCPQAKVAAVIKANAYGHGLLPVASTLTGADLFAVTDCREAMSLRSAGIGKPVLVLQGILDAEDLPAICEHSLQVCLYSLEQIKMLDEYASAHPPAKPLTLWLKLESGMGRLGLTPDAYRQAYHSLQQKPYVENVILMTHMANASLPDSKLTRQQMEAFEETRQQLGDAQSLTSIASSAGLLAWPRTHSDWVRPGLMLYGSSPFARGAPGHDCEALGLEPVMTLESKLISVKQFKAGHNVGYNSQFICPRDMSIGIAAIGYADGYPSIAPNGTPVLVNAKLARTAGRVSMDMLAIDLSGHPEAKAGDTVTLWGEGLPIDEVAKHIGMISYNLFTGITSRVEFVYG